MSDSLEYLLRMWGRWLDAQIVEVGGPRKHPKGSPWAKNTPEAGDTIPEHTLPPDEDEMERVTKAVVQLCAYHCDLGWALTRHYRDGSKESGAQLKRARELLKGYL